MLYYCIINTGSDKASLPQGQKIPVLIVVKSRMILKINIILHMPFNVLHSVLVANAHAYMRSVLETYVRTDSTIYTARLIIEHPREWLASLAD